MYYSPISRVIANIKVITNKILKTNKSPPDKRRKIRFRSQVSTHFKYLNRLYKVQ